MNVFYEEDGNFKVASVLSENAGTSQVESLSGKRSKIKNANIILRFDGALSGFMDEAQQLAAQMEIPFIWECCGADDFTAQEFAATYYGATPRPVETAALALSLHSAPIYFHRKGKGRYRAAPADILQAALAGQEKRRLQLQQVETWTAQLRDKQFPAEWSHLLNSLLYHPDKNSLEWKALNQASLDAKLTPVEVLDAAGAISSHEQYHFGAFVREMFADGIDFPDGLLPSIEEAPLDKAETPAFSIDDITTTEIDDAFSVLPLPQGGWRIGIHIAAPALGVPVGSALDEIAQQRLSTVYMPGNKITMLPESVLQAYSLDEGHWRPALSLYLTIDAQFQVLQRETKLEQIMVEANLRHDALEPFFNDSNFDQDTGHAYWQRLYVLFRLAQQLEYVRGKADSQNNLQRDYSFYVEAGRVRIVERRRGTPIDKLVAELMIEANQYWGGWLAQHNVVGIYRAQQNSKVYMTLKAEPHQGMGVAQYAWSSSPLRRAVDLFNQRQLIAVVRQQAAPYRREDEVIGAVMRRFDVVYQQYRDFQTRMERYWCLQYLRQENLQQITGVVWRENFVRLDGLPYVCKVTSLPPLASGKHVNLAIERIDTLSLHLHTRFIAEIAGEVDSVLPEDDAEMLLELEPAPQVVASEVKPQAEETEAGDVAAG